MFKIGDEVYVKDQGKVFSDYETGAIKMGLKNFIPSYLTYDNIDLRKARVVGVTKNSFNETVYGIRIDERDYIIGESGIDYIPKEILTTKERLQKFFNITGIDYYFFDHTKPYKFRFSRIQVGLNVIYTIQLYNKGIRITLNLNTVRDGLIKIAIRKLKNLFHK